MTPRESPLSGEILIAFQDGKALVRRDGDRIALPEAPDLAGLLADAATVHRFRDPDGIACVAFDAPPDAPTPADCEAVGLRGLHQVLPERLYRLAGRAAQLLAWKRSHRFCGACGGPTVESAIEPAMECGACGGRHYPRIAPAAIILIRRGNEALLARSPGFPPGVYSALAGFVEPGESLEEAAIREVREEVGVEIAGLRYFGSQPWPFPHSLMVGFVADYAGGTIRPQPGEIEDARWFAADAMPLAPPPLSIARALIEDFVRSAGGDPRRLRHVAP